MMKQISHAVACHSIIGRAQARIAVFKRLAHGDLGLVWSPEGGADTPARGCCTIGSRLDGRLYRRCDDQDG
ncbi:hypothetical protein M3J09_011919 [Ascochyta lentis]